MNESLIDKLKKMYIKLSLLEREYDKIEDYETMVHMENQIDELVNQISEIEETLDRE